MLISISSLANSDYGFVAGSVDFPAFSFLSRICRRNFWSVPQAHTLRASFFGCFFLVVNGGEEPARCRPLHHPKRCSCRCDCCGCSSGQISHCRSDGSAIRWTLRSHFLHLYYPFFQKESCPKRRHTHTRALLNIALCWLLTLDHVLFTRGLLPI